MNKADLVNSVASSVGIPKSKAAKAIDSVFSSITKALKSGKGVQLIGFGSFSVSKIVTEMPARAKISPTTQPTGPAPAMIICVLFVID